MDQSNTLVRRTDGTLEAVGCLPEPTEGVPRERKRLVYSSHR